ncbi:branched-chain amino acid transport system II carrier protein [Paenibacillus dakarensis]|uniref:branched-chain amino acid transport system II carrier protein n=1 Tax=Paenibacillus dakarensis TaxID=1527293 RepID=UPI0009E98978|nr:branched-chain amino acid transport system II carrier protein [Paenibacillus dakarensis]
MRNISKAHTFFIGLMLFSLFFGAGNLIFPPILGQQAGEHFWPAIFGFILTGVGLPLLTIIAIALSGRNMQELAGHVHPKFGIIFTIAVYVLIGPSMAIPRVANVAYEMGAQSFIPDDLKTSGWGLFIYTLLFFGVAFWASLNPSKLVDRIGSILTPLLLLGIAGLFVAVIINPHGSAQPAVQEYVEMPVFKGFMEGYLTLDTIAALAFGIIVINAIRDKGVQDNRMIAKATIQAGVVAALGLSLVYAALGYIGVTSVDSYGYAKNGGQLLTLIVENLFGTYGLVLIAFIVTLACLTTCIGLVTACSEYFSTLFHKISYNWIAFIICVLGLLVANLGLNQIISISVPVLLVIYPVSIVLILLSFCERWFHVSPSVYVGAMICTLFISIFDGFKEAGIRLDFITVWFKYIPLYEQGLGWVIPAVAGAVIGFIVGRLRTGSSGRKS